MFGMMQYHCVFLYTYVFKFHLLKFYLMLEIYFISQRSVHSVLKTTCTLSMVLNLIVFNNAISWKVENCFICFSLFISLSLAYSVVLLCLLTRKASLIISRR